jgi:DNA uptake protein ComE-like DNA-binding protein
MARWQRLSMAVVAIALVTLAGQCLKDPDGLLEIAKHEKVVEIRQSVTYVPPAARVQSGDQANKAFEYLRASYHEPHAALQNAQASLLKFRSQLRALTSDIARELLRWLHEKKVWMQSEEAKVEMARLVEIIDQSLLQHVSGLHLACTLFACAFLALASKCCRRRVVALPRTEVAAGEQDVHREGAVSAIMKAPTPLRDRQAHPSLVQRRRRSDSPAPVGEENTHNIAPSSLDEEELLAHLNSDSAEELRLVNGLGDKSIDKIIKWRSKYGTLSDVKDLQSKVGIHPATYANFARAQHLP